MRLEDTLRREADTRFLVSGDLVLDRADHRAWLGGTRMEVGAKALALLDELMCNAGTLVGKDRLFDVAWTDQAVSDAVPTKAIREMRRTLEDNARAPEWIETQHGKGYRQSANRADPCLTPMDVARRADISGCWRVSVLAE